MFKHLVLPSLLLGAFTAGELVGKAGHAEPATHERTEVANRVFEIRTYTTADGKLDALHRRFRDHTMGFFKQHGMTNVAYWTPQEGPSAGNTLIYVLAYPSREAARKSWSDFNADPAWQKVRAASEENGKIVTKVESVFVDPTDYSPMK